MSDVQPEATEPAVEDTAPAETPAEDTAPVDAAPVVEETPAPAEEPAVAVKPSWKSELADLLRQAAGSHVLKGNPLDSATILNDVADLLEKA